MGGGDFQVCHCASVEVRKKSYIILQFGAEICVIAYNFTQMFVHFLQVIIIMFYSTINIVEKYLTIFC